MKNERSTVERGFASEIYEKALKKWGIRSTHFQYTTNEN